MTSATELKILLDYFVIIGIVSHMKFSDILRFTRSPSYKVNADWHFLPTQLEHWSEKGSAIVDLNPDFQRLHVWTPEQQTAYVEYILKGGMSGRDIYFNCTGWMDKFEGPFVIVDGKQRIHAAMNFIDNKVPIFGGKYHKDFEGRLPHEAGFVFHVNDLKTRAEVIQWYLEMNTGGTPHTAEEINKAKKLLDDCKKDAKV
jgi:hypothetical protein